MWSADLCDRHKTSVEGTSEADMTLEYEARFQAAIAMAQLSYELPIANGEQVLMQPTGPEHDTGRASVPNNIRPLGDAVKKELKKVKVKRITGGGKSSCKNDLMKAELARCVKTKKDLGEDAISKISGKLEKRKTVCSTEKQVETDERVSKDTHSSNSNNNNSSSSSGVYVKTSMKSCCPKIRSGSTKPVGKKSRISDHLENRKTSKRDSESSLLRRNRKSDNATKFPSDGQDDLEATEAGSKRGNSTEKFSENCPNDIVNPYLPPTESNTALNNSIPSSTLAISTFGLCNVLVPAFSLMPFDAHMKKLSDVKPLLAYLPASSLNPTPGAKETGATFRIPPARPLVLLPGQVQLAFGLPIVRSKFQTDEIKQKTEKIYDSSSKSISSTLRSMQDDHVSKLDSDFEDLPTEKSEFDSDRCSLDQSGFSVHSTNAEKSSGTSGVHYKDVVQSYPRIKEEKIDVKSDLESIARPEIRKKLVNLNKTKTGLTVKLEKDYTHDHDQETLDKTKALAGQTPDDQITSFIGHFCSQNTPPGHSSLHSLCGGSLGSPLSCPPTDYHRSARTSLTIVEKSPTEDREGSPSAEIARCLTPLGPEQKKRRGVLCFDDAPFQSSACTEYVSATAEQEDNNIMSNCSPTANEEHVFGGAERGWYDEGMVGSSGIRAKESDDRRRYQPFLDCHLPPKKRKYVDENAESSTESKTVKAEDPCRSSNSSKEENRVPGKGNSIRFSISGEVPDLKMEASEDFSQEDGKTVPELRTTSDALHVYDDRMGKESNEIVNDDESKETSLSLSSSLSSPPTTTANHSNSSTNVVQLESAIKPDEDGDLPLHVAVVQGLTDVIESLLNVMSKLQTSPDFFNRNRQTPLHLAVITKQTEVVRRLLLAGASPNLPDRMGNNSIHLAVKGHCSDCLQVLLSQSKLSVDIDAMNYEGLTSLHLAVQRGDVDAVETLVSFGAQVNGQDGKNGRSALYYAAELGHLATADRLLALGASVGIPSYSGCLPVNAARTNAAMVRLLERHSSTGSYSVENQCGSDPMRSTAEMNSAASGFRSRNPKQPDVRSSLEKTQKNRQTKKTKKETAIGS